MEDEKKLATYEAHYLNKSNQPVTTRMAAYDADEVCHELRLRGIEKIYHVYLVGRIEK